MKSHDYEIVIEDADGRAIRTVTRTTLAGRPLVGEEVVVDNSIYIVRAVRHVQEVWRTRRIYTWPRVFVRSARKQVRH